jgi:hypothetical protein
MSDTAAAVRMACVALLLGCAVPAAAHPPYESAERIVIDHGRSLHLTKDYIDGIMAIDPVKLVVRDDDDRTVAETEYGRDVAVVCWESRPCLVFRYESEISVAPSNVWRLDGGQLIADSSLSMYALGLVVPLWEHFAGYVFALISLAVPILAGWSISQMGKSAWRRGIEIVAALVALPYMAIWLYAVVQLSYLSLPLVILAAAFGKVAASGARRAALAAGVADDAMRKAAQWFAISIAAIGSLGVVVTLALGIRAALREDRISFDEPTVRPPLTHAMVTREDVVAREIYLTVADDVGIEDLVNLDLFNGFEPDMTRDAAELRLGPATGRWLDPDYNVRAAYYDRPGGRVSLVRQGASEWSTVGHPSDCSHDYLFRDARVRGQIMQWLPPLETVEVSLRSRRGAVTMRLGRSACTYLVLDGRDD